MSTTISYKHASLIRRLFAAVLDGLCIGFLGSILMALLGCLIVPTWPPTYTLEVGIVGFAIYGFLIYFVTELSGVPITLAPVILILADLIFGFGSCNPLPRNWVRDLAAVSCMTSLFLSPIYHGVMESRPAKATLGKLIMGIFVSDLNGNKISFMRAMFRYLAKGLSTLTFGVGYFMALGKTGQALHDKITGCIVLGKDRPIRHQR